MRTFVLAVAAGLALFAATPAFADGPLPAGLRSAGVTQEQWDALQTEVRRAAARANVSERALASVAERLGLALATRAGLVDVADILSELDQLAARIGELEVSLAAISRQEDPAIAALVAQARNAISAGDLDAADAALADARRARAARNAQLQTQLNAGRLEESAIAAAQAEVAYLRRDYLRAAAFYDEAAALAPEGSRERYVSSAASGYMFFFGAGFSTQPDAEAELLRHAVDRFDAALAMPRVVPPGRWALHRSMRVDALERLIALNEPDAPARAVATLEMDLTVLTREDDSWTWSRIQMNLGRALQAQHARSQDGDVTVLRRAAAAYEAALTVMTFGGGRDDHWAEAQENLGDVLMRLDTHGETGALERAIVAYEQATRHPSMRVLNVGAWAERRIKFGNALRLMGHRLAPRAEAGGYFFRAISVHNTTLSWLTFENTAVWTAANYDLALAHRAVGERYDASLAARAALEGAQRLGDAAMTEQIQALLTQLAPR